MGYNLSGIVIDKNFLSNTGALSQILNHNLVFDGETDTTGLITGEEKTACINVYFSGSGTLILAPQDLCLERHYGYPGCRVLTFALSKTAMAFYFGYTENQEIVRSKMEVDGLLIEDQGDPLDTEAKAIDTSEVIWKQLAKVLGREFEAIQPEARWIRYAIEPGDSRRQGFRSKNCGN